MGSRAAPYDKHKECDNCGERGAYDFMGDYFCGKCLSYTDSDSVIQKKVSHKKRKNEPQKEKDLKGVTVHVDIPRFEGTMDELDNLVNKWGYWYICRKR